MKTLPFSLTPEKRAALEMNLLSRPEMDLTIQFGITGKRNVYANYQVCDLKGKTVIRFHGRTHAVYFANPKISFNKKNLGTIFTKAEIIEILAAHDASLNGAA